MIGEEQHLNFVSRHFEHSSILYGIIHWSRKIRGFKISLLKGPGNNPSGINVGTCCLADRFGNIAHNSWTYVRLNHDKRLVHFIKEEYPIFFKWYPNQPSHPVYISTDDFKLLCDIIMSLGNTAVHAHRTSVKLALPSCPPKRFGGYLLAFQGKKVD